MPKSTRKIEWKKDTAIKRRISLLTRALGASTIVPSRIYTYRSYNAKTRAYARIWGLSYLWQKTLNLAPAYIIEVISERFDKLTESQKDEVLLHELAHIPKNFSGALVPHKRRGVGNFHDKLKEMIRTYQRNK